MTEAPTIAVRLSIIPPDTADGAPAWRAIGVPLCRDAAVAESAGGSVAAAVSTLRAELVRSLAGREDHPPRILFWMPVPDQGDGSPRQRPYCVMMRLYSPRTTQGSGQWAAVTVPSAVNGDASGLYAWGDDPASAVASLSESVLDYAEMVGDERQHVACFLSDVVDHL